MILCPALLVPTSSATWSHVPSPGPVVVDKVALADAADRRDEVGVPDVPRPLLVGHGDPGVAVGVVGGRARAVLVVPPAGRVGAAELGVAAGVHDLRAEVGAIGAEAGTGRVVRQGVLVGVRLGGVAVEGELGRVAGPHAGRDRPAGRRDADKDGGRSRAYRQAAGMNFEAARRRRDGGRRHAGGLEQTRGEIGRTGVAGDEPATVVSHQGDDMVETVALGVGSAPRVGPGDEGDHVGGRGGRSGRGGDAQLADRDAAGDGGRSVPELAGQHTGAAREGRLAPREWRTRQAAGGERAGLGRAQHALRLGLEVGDRRGRDGCVGGGRDAARDAAARAARWRSGRGGGAAGRWRRDDERDDEQRKQRRSRVREVEHGDPLSGRVTGSWRRL